MAYDATLNERRQVQYDVLTYKLDATTNNKLVYKANAVLNKGLNPSYFSGNNTKIVNILNSFYKDIDYVKDAVTNVYSKFNPIILDTDNPDNQLILDQMRVATGKDTLIESISLYNKFKIFTNLVLFPLK